MKKSLLSLFVIFLILGCTHKIYVALLPDYNASVNSSGEMTSIKPPLKFIKGIFEDKRPDVSLFATFKQQVHTFNLYAERPIESAIFDGLAVFLDKSGHTWADSGDGQIKVNLQLLSSSASRNAGMIMVGATSSIQIKLDFINMKTGDQVYSQIYNGNDNRQQAMIGLMDMVNKSIDASIINCINNVAADQNLVSILKKLG